MDSARIQNNRRPIQGWVWIKYTEIINWYLSNTSWRCGNQAGYQSNIWWSVPYRLGPHNFNSTHSVCDVPYVWHTAWDSMIEPYSSTHSIASKSSGYISNAWWTHELVCFYDCSKRHETNLSFKRWKSTFQFDKWSKRTQCYRRQATGNQINFM